MMNVDPKRLEIQAKEIKPKINVTLTNALNGEGVNELIKMLDL